jgi:hypothetical protein
VLIIGGAIIGLGLIWIAVTGLLAKQRAAQLEARLAVVKALVTQGRIQQARVVAQDIPRLAANVHRLTTGPAWWLAAHIPFLGEPLATARGMTSAADEVGSDAVPALLRVAGQINPNQLRVNGSTIRLQPLILARPELDRAAASLSSAGRQVRQLSGSWLGAVDSRRVELLRQVDSIRGYVDAAARIAHVLPPMLGNATPQRYFIGLENEAELRGTGGLPGAFTIAVASHGTLRFTRFESDSVLLPASTGDRIDTGLHFGRQYDAAYGASSPTSSYLDSNVSPDFRYAAQIWAAMWKRVSGQQVDGVAAVDPTALSYFLNAVGAATIPGIGPLNGGNVVSLTEKTEYSAFPNNTERKAFLVNVLRASARRLTSGAGTSLGIVRAASRSATEHRLLIWSRTSAIEHVLTESNFAGSLPNSRRPFSGLILNNTAAGKLDYYVSRGLAYARSGCGPVRDVRVTITMNNSAPKRGLPLYVTTRLDADPPANAKPGDTRVLLDYYATAGAQLESVTLDDKPATASVLNLGGHAIFRMDVELPRATTQTIVLHLSEPAGQGQPIIWRQPGVHPLTVSEFSQSC